MTRPVDPYVVRKLADCIEPLPRYINNPQKMPFVQEVVQRAFEQIRFDREALARGHELRGDLRKAEKYREPVTSVWLSDSDKEALKDGFEEDETGIFEVFERHAADIGEWVKECRRPRDAELFRSRLSFVCGEALLHPVQGVEVSPGVYKLDLSSWEADAAKPLCDYLRQLADDLATESPPGVRRASLKKMILAHLDSDQWTATRNGETAGFRGQQIPWKLFCRLLQAQGVVVPYAELLRAGWTEEDLATEDNLRPHITTIRGLIKPLGLKVDSHRNQGYSLSESEKNQI